MIVNRIREMESFMLGKEIKRNGLYLVMSMGQRKKKKKVFCLELVSHE